MYMGLLATCKSLHITVLYSSLNRWKFVLRCFNSNSCIMSRYTCQALLQRKYPFDLLRQTSTVHLFSLLNKSLNLSEENIILLIDVSHFAVSLKLFMALESLRSNDVPNWWTRIWWHCIVFSSGCLQVILPFFFPTMQGLHTVSSENFWYGLLNFLLAFNSV